MNNSNLFNEIEDTHVMLPDVEFSRRFLEHWSATKTRVVKFESLQDYPEDSESGFTDFLAGDISAFARKIRKAREEEDAQLYSSLRGRSANFMRLRSVRFPLSPYVQFEYYTYFVSARLGEKIRFVEEGAINGIAGVHLPDMVTFDDFALLQYKYDEDGRFEGGYDVTDSGRIKRITDILEKLFALGRPFELMMDADPRIVAALTEGYDLG
jgi:hypothetical protein